MHYSLATMQRALSALLVFCIIFNLVATAPAVAKNSDAKSSAIAPVADTGSYEEVFAAAEETTNQPPVATSIPSKEETSQQLNLHKIKPLTFAHQVEGTLRLVGLEKQTNAILDLLCLLAYAYLLRLTSKSRYYAMEAIQIFGFMCFPALPIIQSINNSFRTGSKILYDGASGIRHTLACLTGQYAIVSPQTSHSPGSSNGKSPQLNGAQAPLSIIRQRLTHVMSHELDYSQGEGLSFVRRIGGLFLAGLTIVASITTLHIHLDHPVRSDWDSVGIASDQRHGWLSSSATLASLLSVIALLINSRWTIKRDFMRPDLPTGVLAESEVSVTICVI